MVWGIGLRCSTLRHRGEVSFRSAQRDITGILDTICTAFGTLRDGLLQDTALDVSAEISALETVLCQDGLAGDEGLQAK